MASLLSDWSHEIATALMPAFLASLGVAAVWLGLIEGVADGLSSFAKLGSGFYTDRLRRRKPIAVVGYVVTAVGTASFALASSAWHVLIARAGAWLGRGVRTPVRKALLAGAVDAGSYGRAFGFERMMDTLGAIAGPATALLLLPLLSNRYAELFALTLIPGLLAAAAMAFLVRERGHTPVGHVRFADSLRALPMRFRRLALAVGLFGMGDFAHTLLILLAAQALTPRYGAREAALLAMGLYLLHNLLYAGCSLFSGALADRRGKGRLLAAGYAVAGVMAALIVLLPMTLWTLGVVFALGGIYVGAEETLEDAISAEIVERSSHGMAFGTLSTVNGIGDFASSLMVGALWSVFGRQVAFGYAGLLFLAGALLVLRIDAAPPGAKAPGSPGGAPAPTARRAA